MTLTYTDDADESCDLSGDADLDECRAACPRSTLTWRYNGGAVPPTASFAAALSAVSPSATTTRRKSGSTCVGEAIGQSNVLPVER